MFAYIPDNFMHSFLNSFLFRILSFLTIMQALVTLLQED